MAQLPTIHLIYAEDATAFLDRLKEILQNLKAERRISKHVPIDAESFATLSGQVQDEDMVLLVLSKELDSQKEGIEQQLRKLKQQHPSLKVAEIILDHIPYENEFITFPADLKPIRNREDTEAVWGGIAQNLRDIFPVQSPETPPTPISTSSPWPRVVKWAGIIIAILFMVFFMISVFDVFDKVREIDPPDVEPAPSQNGAAEVEKEPISQQGCYVTTGMLTQCHVEPDPFSPTRGRFPDNKKYNVIDTKVYEHGNLSEIYFFRIRDQEEGLEGWVRSESLDFFSEACINE